MLGNVSLLMAAAFAATAASAADLDAQALHARSLAATCASCHSATRGDDRAIAALERMPESAIVRAMQEFRAGTRPGTVMPQLAKGYTDEQVAAVAAWYARSQP